jgi:type VI protein secretion system component VasK
MRWRRHRPTEADEHDRRSQEQLQEQLREAEDELEAVQERTSEIAEIARTLRRLREQNHFAPLVWEAFGGDDR